MPLARFLIQPFKHSIHYHCVSRVVDRNFVFGTEERDVFRKVLRQVEAFSGVRVLTWTILSNHFHVLLAVPPKPEEPLTHEEILERCRALYSPKQMIAIECEFDQALKVGGDVIESLHSRFLKRMWDLSEFMKTLKHRFTKWFNRSHQRVGTLWESRFRSVLVEASWNTLLKVAAYIDLNAVRAGIVDDPKDYRWCGYSEALTGDRFARRGLASVLADLKPNANWGDVAPSYRKILFGIGEETATRPGISRDLVAKTWAAGGKLTLAQLLRCRVRHFSDGTAIGSAAFIEDVFSAYRLAFGKKRTSGSRRLSRDEWQGLRCARALRISPISPGGDG